MSWQISCLAFLDDEKHKKKFFFFWWWWFLGAPGGALTRDATAVSGILFISNELVSIHCPGMNLESDWINPKYQ